jgi:hypothetical protein
MLVGSTKISAFAAALPETTKQVARAIGNASETVGNASFSTDGNASEKIRRAGDEEKRSDEEIGETIASAGRDAARTSIEFGHQIRQSVQQNVTTTIEQQPLLLGVLGIGIGAGIASMFSATKAEQDLMGKAGAAVKDKIRDVAAESDQRAGQIFDDVKNEAREQELTVTAAKESLKAVAEKVKITASAGKESVSTRV